MGPLLRRGCGRSSAVAAGRCRRALRWSRLVVAAIGVGLLGAVFTAGPEPAGALTGCVPAATQVALFVDRSYGGSCVILGVGTYGKVAALGIPDNSVSSLKVGSSVVAVVHQDVDFGGLDNHSWQSFGASDTNLADNTYHALQSAPDNGGRVEDSISALWVMRRGCVPGPMQVAVFDGSAYSGACTVVGTGNYANSVLASIPADFVGSLKVGSATKAAVWVNPGFSGPSCTYAPGTTRSTLCFADNELSSLVVSADSTPPMLAVSHVADGQNGWNVTSPVTVTVQVSDAETGVLGVPSCKDNGVVVSLTDEVSQFSARIDGSGTHVVSCTARDYLGNTRTLSDTVKIDAFAPSVRADATVGGRSYTSGSWTNDDVTVRFSCTDAHSGVASVSPPVTVTAEGVTQSLTGTCTDKAGNTASATFDAVAIDKTSPSPSAVATVGGAPYTAGTWSSDDVVVSFACQDALSGVASVSPPVAVSTEGANQAASGTCTDRAGNQANAAVTGISIDKAPPVLSASATVAGQPYQAGTWTTGPVDVRFACTDAGSGVASVSPMATVSIEGSDQSVTGTCTDKLGKRTTLTLSGINIDTTKPVVGFSGNLGSYAFEDQVAITCSAFDALSGLAQNTCADVVGPASALGVGPHTLSATAVDRAGNRVTATTVVVVRPRVVRSVASGNWSDPTMWNSGQPPGPTDLVTVASGHTVTVDVEGTAVAGLMIESGAALVFDPNRDVTLESTGNVVVAGRFSMRPASPASVHTLRFTGIDESRFVGGGMEVLDSDVGLWVVDMGSLDVAGSPKTSWTRVAAAVPAGATSITLAETPVGWQIGDEISIAPTEPPSVGAAAWSGFDLRRVVGISDNVVTLDRGTDRPHPIANGTWGAEVMNLTRNTRIEGTPTGRTHVMVMAMTPQTIADVVIRYTGPRRPTSTGSDFVLGRYGLHFHMGGNATRGSLIDGVVVRDGGSHAFVPHGSNGITFRDTIAYNQFEDAYWWDPGDITNDVTWEHAIAAQLKADPPYRGYRLTGFALGRGTGNAVRNSVAVGIQGNVDASGFSWPESANAKPNLWDFTDDIAHNNKVDGLFVWQNTSGDHLIDRYVGYYNSGFGIDHGAYTNSYVYRDSILFENRLGGINQRALGSSEGPLTFTGMTVIGGPVAVTLAEHALDNSRVTIYRDCNFTGQANVKIEVAEARNAGRYDFVNCDLQPSDIHITSAVAGMRIRVQRPDRIAFQIDAAGTVTTIPRFDPPDTPPSVTLASPADGATFAAGTSITLIANASDADGTVRQVEFFMGSVSLGIVSAGPYSVAWQDVPAGIYALTAVATDDEGVATRSAVVNIVVSGP